MKDLSFSETLKNSGEIFLNPLTGVKKVLVVSLFCCLLLSFSSCKRKNISQDIQECDTMGNYYEDGEHYISKEFLNDEEGTLNYAKLFEKTKIENTKCYPGNTFQDGNN